MKKKRTLAQIAADTKRTGRPPIPKEERRSYLLNVLITQAERQKFECLAKTKGLTLSEVLMLPEASRLCTKGT